MSHSNVVCEWPRNVAQININMLTPNATVVWCKTLPHISPVAPYISDTWSSSSTPEELFSSTNWTPSWKAAAPHETMHTSVHLRVHRAKHDDKEEDGRKGFVPSASEFSISPLPHHDITEKSLKMDTEGRIRPGSWGPPNSSACYGSLLRVFPEAFALLAVSSLLVIDPVDII